MKRLILFLPLALQLAASPVYVRFSGYGTNDYNYPVWLDNDSLWTRISTKRMWFGHANRRSVETEYSTGTDFAAYYYNGSETFSSDQYAQAYGQIEQNWSDVHGPAAGVRLSEAGGYLCVQSYAASMIVKVPSGTILAQHTPGSTTANLIRCEASGSTISMKLNGTTVVSATDSSYPSGRPGLGGNGTTTPSARGGSLWDWTAGNLADAALPVTGAEFIERGMVGRAYSAQMIGSGGDGTYAWSVASGSLPPGLSISSAGLISGIPTAAGMTALTLRATSNGVNGDLPISITIRSNAGATLLDDYAGPIRTHDGLEIYSPTSMADNYPVFGHLSQEANTLRFDWRPNGCDAAGWTKDCGPYFWTFPGPPYTNPNGFAGALRAQGAWDVNANRMTMRVMCDRDFAPVDNTKQTFNLGTYVKSHSDSANPNNAEGGGHLYHQMLFRTPANRWTNITLNRVPQHVRGWTYSTAHHDEEIRDNFAPGIIPDIGNYFDTMTSFYRTVWVDNNSEWLTCHYADTGFATVLHEPDYWIASIASYYTGARYEVTWRAPEAASYQVRYSTTGSLKAAGFSAGTGGGTVTAAGRGHAEWDSSQMTEGASGLWVGIRPVMPVAAASNAAPVQVMLHGHGLSSGDQIACSGIGGNAAANGTWTVTVVDQDNVTLDASAGNGAFTSGGTCTATSDAVNFAEVFIPKDAYVSAPSGLAAAVGSMSVNLSWTNADSYDGVYIERRTIGTFWRQVAALPVGSVSWSDTSIVRGIQHFYRVRGMKSQTYSPFSVSFSITPPRILKRSLSGFAVFGGKAAIQ